MVEAEERRIKEREQSVKAQEEADKKKGKKVKKQHDAEHGETKPKVQAP